jgi:hypothetical protein
MGQDIVKHLHSQWADRDEPSEMDRLSEAGLVVAQWIDQTLTPNEKAGRPAEVDAALRVLRSRAIGSTSGLRRSEAA